MPISSVQGPSVLNSALIAACSILMAVSNSTVLKAQTITPQQAHDIAVNAYLYFYSPVTMDLTRKQLTNMAPGKTSIGGPMNTFANIGAYPTAEMRTVVRPNFDTLYSSAWLDLTKEPVVISVPDTHGRYYLLPMLDMWTDVFASPGWRTTGTQAGTFVIVAPGWRPDLKRQARRRVQAAPEHPAYRRADALRLGYRPHEDGWPGRL